MPIIDHTYPIVWQKLTKTARSGIHGPGHWERVRRNGMRIAAGNGADVRVVELFALLHDYCRWDDGSDLDHGRRAAEYATSNRADLPPISDEQFDTLISALAGHVDGHISDHPTIGACWDADRLDIGRVGILINPAYLSTDAAKSLINQI